MRRFFIIASTARNRRNNSWGWLGLGEVIPVMQAKKLACIWAWGITSSEGSPWEIIIAAQSFMGEVKTVTEKESCLFIDMLSVEVSVTYITKLSLIMP